MVMNWTRLTVLTALTCCAVGCKLPRIDLPDIPDVPQVPTNLPPVVVDPPVTPEPVQPNGAPAWGEITVGTGGLTGGSPHMGDYKETLKLTSVTMRPGLVSWRFADLAPAKLWPSSRVNRADCCGSVVFVVNRNGKWRQCMAEWFALSVMDNELPETFLAVRGNGKRVFDDEFQPRNGETIWVFISGYRYSYPGVKERSNLVPVIVGGMP